MLMKRLCDDEKGKAASQPLVADGPLALSFVLCLTPGVAHPGKHYCPPEQSPVCSTEYHSSFEMNALPNKDTWEFLQCTYVPVLLFSVSVLLCYIRAGIMSDLISLGSLPLAMVPSKHFGSFFSVLVHDSPFCSFSLLRPHPYPQSSLLLSLLAISCKKFEKKHFLL